MYKLVTSNENKYQEFIRLGLPLSSRICLDLPEVMGTSREVAIYKAIEAGSGYLIEDTILSVNGEEIVDIRYQLDTLSSTRDVAEWKTTLAVIEGEYIKIAEGIVTGFIGPDSTNGETVFGFDAQFYPNGQQPPVRSLHDLSKAGLKDHYSARVIATQNLLKGNVVLVPLNEVPEWSGRMQGD